MHMAEALSADVGGQVLLGLLASAQAPPPPG